MSGKKLPQGKIIATEGEIGVHADTLMPGLYWRFPIIWKLSKSRVTQIPQGSVGIIELTPALQVPKEVVGVVVAMDGTPLPSGYIVAPAPKGDHKHFQDGQAFISAEGYRGPQLATLQ